MNFGAVILAGGKSSRMGRDKAWMEIEGQSLLMRQVCLVREAGAKEVFVSGRAGTDYSEFGCRVLRDRLVDAGPIGGIERALGETTSPLLLVLAVDMPRVSGEIEPLVAFYPRVALGLIEEMISESQPSGLRRESLSSSKRFPSATAFAEKCVKHGLAKFVDVAESETDFFTNWNSPADVK